MSTNSPLIIVISAPSGTGKTTIVRELIKNNDNLVASVSYTTRNKRANEIDGKDYTFVSSELFSSMAEEKSFIEHAKVFDCFYGTPKKEVEDSLNKGLNVILEIDWQGAMQIKREKPDCLMLFIIPPSKEELMLRLRKRGTDSNNEIRLRFDEALNDINQYANFDKVFINKDVMSTVQAITTFIKDPSKANSLNDEVMTIIRSFRS
jgi:guanylate kinase|tara:strand:- start:39 stop:656 length:618 start_codon:yes stop_codon:yes gene_type:complete